MEKVEIRKTNPSIHRLKYFNDTVSIARSEMIMLFSKPEKYADGLRISLEMAIDYGDYVSIVPFELRVPFAYSGGQGVIYGFTQTRIYTTNSDLSRQIKTEVNKCIADLRKRNRKA